MIPDSHQGAWAGPSRLFHPDPLVPLRSDGTIVAEARVLTYTWAHGDAEQSGAIELHGPEASVRAEWRDSWHAPDGQVCHGCWDGHLLRLWSAYPAGDGTWWGWRLEADARDPEQLTFRMFNVPLDVPEQMAHDIRATRT